MRENFDAFVLAVASLASGSKENAECAYQFIANPAYVYLNWDHFFQAFRSFLSDFRKKLDTNTVIFWL